MVEYDAHLLKRTKPEGAGHVRTKDEEPPEDKRWAKCWGWMARGYSMPRTAEEVGVNLRTLQDWSASNARFQAGLAMAEKAWDVAAIKREIAEILAPVGTEDPQDWGRDVHAPSV